MHRFNTTLPNQFFAGSLCMLVIWMHLQAFSSPAHMDEYDYLFVGKNLLAGMEWPSLTYIFGANFNWYLYGLGDRFFGGLDGARLISSAAGIISLYFTFRTVWLVWNSRKVAFIATMLLAASSSHVFISHLATYDVLSFALFCASLYTLLLCCLNQSRYHVAQLVTGALLFSAAVLSKYILIIYVPFIGALLLYLVPRMALLALLILGMTLGIYAALNLPELKVLYHNQVLGVHGANTTRQDIFRLQLPYLAIPLLLSLLGFLFSLKSTNPEHKKPGHLFVVSFLLACPMVIYHLYSGNMISQYKHIVYALYFLAPCGAWLIVTVLNGSQSVSHRLLMGLLLLIPIAAVSKIQLNSMQMGYPRSEAVLLEALSVAKPEIRVLSEDPYLFRYALYGSVAQSQIKESGWFDYNSDGVHEAEDVRRALRAREFELVLITDQIHPHENEYYRKILREEEYTLLHDQAYSLSSVMTKNRTGSVSLYKRNSVTSPVTQSQY